MCFVISPMDRTDSRIRQVFEELIAPACHQVGLEPRRAADIAGQNRLAVITGSLSSAPLAIAYLGTPSRGWRPDVIIEVGFRLATGLPLVLLSESLVRGNPNASGRTFRDLLPFNLIYEDIIEIDEKPEATLPKLEAEIRVLWGHGRREAPPSIHPIVEAKCSGSDEEITFVDGSPDAIQLFGPALFQKTRAPQHGRRTLRDQVPEKQLHAYQRDLFREIAECHWLRSGWSEHPVDVGVLKPRVPLLFKDEAFKPIDLPRVGYLPLVTRYSFEAGTFYMRILFLKVSAGLKFTEEGYFVYQP